MSISNEAGIWAAARKTGSSRQGRWCIGKLLSTTGERKTKVVLAGLISHQINQINVGQFVNMDDTECCVNIFGDPRLIKISCPRAIRLQIFTRTVFPDELFQNLIISTTKEDAT
jgi:hypothetical protein